MMSRTSATGTLRLLTVVALPMFGFLVVGSYLVGVVAVTAVALLAAAVAVLARCPRFAFVVWITTFCFVPFWAGSSSPFYLPPTSLVALLILLGSAVAGPLRLTVVDLYVAGFVVLTVVPITVNLARPGDVANVLTQWFLSFAAARVLLPRIPRGFALGTIALIFGIVGALAVVEFFTAWNPYYSWAVDNSQYLAWGHSQDRGGLVRSEWAFGHAIALSNCLALALPCALACKLPVRLRYVLAIAMLAGAVVSFSRGGILSTVLALLIVVTCMEAIPLSRRGRVLLVGGLGLGGLAVAGGIAQVFRDAGAEAAESLTYRARLTDLVPSMNPFGLAEGYSEPAPGLYFFGGFKSIDSTFVLLGLSFGYVAAVIALATCVWLYFRLFTGRATVATAAICAVVPGLFTVALITQFGSLFWLFVGFFAVEYSEYLVHLRGAGGNLPADVAQLSYLGGRS
jgi:hypothetical protein